MGAILVFLERREGKVKPAGLQALSLAARLSSGDPVAALALGTGASEAAAAAGAHGAKQLVVAEDAVYDAFPVEAIAHALAAAAKQVSSDTILVPGTTLGRDAAARAAARLDTGLLSDVVELERQSGGALRGRRPIYSGKADAWESIPSARPAMATLRPNVFPAAPGAGGPAEIVRLDHQAPAARAVVVRTELPASQEIDVAEASIIVSGGRGLKEPANFALIRGLADALGGAVGASRAVVDAGWISHAHQVGQTGKVVSPSLYVACGISGAIQHLAGMSSSKVIVAINKDPDAPIFKAATYGIVGDLFEVVPTLTEEIKKVRAS
ncbi:MAG TPA: electron transfer flavoprotein subunit alpha/FixB family protein [Candidatus Polarisedimenticolaceae bacterium]|nr:electron transfer flavoprotein subunit alpha/FixB family protein [Candidatus Polarisedimenticolaceae bacterium]